MFLLKLLLVLAPQLNNVTGGETTLKVSWDIASVKET